MNYSIQDNFEEFRIPKRRYSTDIDTVISILSIESKNRTWQQLKLLCQKFEQNVKYFSQLQMSQGEFIKLMSIVTLEKKSQFQTVFNQGEAGRKMYIILQGEVGILVKENDEKYVHDPQKSIKTFDDLLSQKFSNFRLVASKSQYDYFGEIAIENRIPRTATIVTKQTSIFAIITFEAYQQFLRELQTDNLILRSVTIAKMYPFILLNEQHLQQILHNYESLNLQAGTILYKDGWRNEYIYLILNGEVLLQTKHYVDNASATPNQLKYFINYQKQIRLKNIGLYSVGHIIGDYELYKKSQFRLTTAIVKINSKIIKINLQQYVDVIEHTLSAKWHRNYLTQKYDIKEHQQSIEISETQITKQPSYIPPKLKQMIIRMRQHHEHTKISSQKYQEIIQPKDSPFRETQHVLSPLNLRDKSILKYLVKETSLPKFNSTTIPQFSVEKFANALKTRVEFTKIMNNINEGVTSYRFYSQPSMTSKSNQSNKFMIL